MVATSVFCYKVMIFYKNLGYFCNKYVVKIFQKSPNLVTLHTVLLILLNPYPHMLVP